MEGAYGCADGPGLQTAVARRTSVSDLSSRAFRFVITSGARDLFSFPICHHERSEGPPLLSDLSSRAKRGTCSPLPRKDDGFALSPHWPLDERSSSPCYDFPAPLIETHGFPLPRHSRLI